MFANRGWSEHPGVGSRTNGGGFGERDVLRRLLAQFDLEFGCADVTGWRGCPVNARAVRGRSGRSGSGAGQQGMLT
jgi:hypothetical protein